MMEWRKICVFKRDYCNQSLYLWLIYVFLIHDPSTQSIKKQNKLWTHDLKKEVMWDDFFYLAPIVFLSHVNETWIGLFFDTLNVWISERDSG